MEQKLRVEGIYDQRTYRQLKLSGVKDFCFDFSPKSLNFIQEYVFLEQILNLVDPQDRIFLHFSRSNDPMIAKIVDDIKKAGNNLENIYFEIDEWSSEVRPLNFSYNYILNYNKNLDSSSFEGKNFKGLTFDFNFFEELHRQNLINNFANNFYTRFNSYLNDQIILVLKIDWHTNLISSLFDLFDFNLLSIPINSKIEVCYRNVDLKKLNIEMEILKKNSVRFFDLC